MWGKNETGRQAETSTDTNTGTKPISEGDIEREMGSSCVCGLPNGAHEAEGRDAGQAAAEGGEADGNHDEIEQIPDLHVAHHLFLFINTGRTVAQPQSA